MSRNDNGDNKNPFTNDPAKTSDQPVVVNPFEDDLHIETACETVMFTAAVIDSGPPAVESEIKIVPPWLSRWFVESCASEEKHNEDELPDNMLVIRDASMQVDFLPVARCGVSSVVRKC